MECQRHYVKLKSSNVSIHQRFAPIEPCCDNNSFSTQWSRYLGMGGIGIMYKREIEQSICELVDIYSSCTIGLQIKRHCDRSLYIFGVYLPADERWR